MSTNLKLSQLGALREITLEDVDIIPYIDEKVIRTFHYLQFENESAFRVKTEFSGSEILHENYDQSVELENLSIEEPMFDFSYEEEDVLKEMILQNIQEHGGFEALIREYVNVQVQPDRIGEGVEICSIREEVDDDESIVIYLDVVGVNTPLMISMHKDYAVSLPRELDDPNCEIQFDIADVCRDMRDVPAGIASDFIDARTLINISHVVREPLKLAIEQFVDEQVQMELNKIKLRHVLDHGWESDNLFRVCLTLTDELKQWLDADKSTLYCEYEQPNTIRYFIERKNTNRAFEWCKPDVDLTKNNHLTKFIMNLVKLDNEL